MCARSGRELLAIVNLFIKARETMCLASNIGKTKGLRQYNVDFHCVPPSISIHGKLLANVDHFSHFLPFKQGKQ